MQSREILDGLRDLIEQHEAAIRGHPNPDIGRLYAEVVGARLKGLAEDD